MRHEAWKGQQMKKHIPLLAMTVLFLWIVAVPAQATGALTTQVAFAAAEHGDFDHHDDRDRDQYHHHGPNRPPDPRPLPVPEPGTALLLGSGLLGLGLLRRLRARR
jgi:hypothetical protein